MRKERLVKQVLDYIEGTRHNMFNPGPFAGYDVLNYEVVKANEVLVYFQGYIGDEPDEDDVVAVRFTSKSGIVKMVR